MAGLEEMGVLFQPHTSAGRVPTPAGMRYYVNYLHEQNLLHSHHAHQGAAYRVEFEREFSGLGDQMGRAAQRAGELLSQVSALPSIVSLSGLNHMRLNDIQLSRVGDRRVPGVFVGQGARALSR